MVDGRCGGLYQRGLNFCPILSTASWHDLTWPAYHILPPRFHESMDRTMTPRCFFSRAPGQVHPGPLRAPQSGTTS